MKLFMTAAIAAILPLAAMAEVTKGVLELEGVEFNHVEYDGDDIVCDDANSYDKDWPTWASALGVPNFLGSGLGVVEPLGFIEYGTFGDGTSYATSTQYLSAVYVVGTEEVCVVSAGRKVDGEAS